LKKESIGTIKKEFYFSSDKLEDNTLPEKDKVCQMRESKNCFDEITVISEKKKPKIVEIYSSFSNSQKNFNKCDKCLEYRKELEKHKHSKIDLIAELNKLRIDMEIINKSNFELKSFLEEKNKIIEKVPISKSNYRT